MRATERVRNLVLDIEPLELADFGLDSAVRTHSQRQAVAGGWTLHVDAPKPDVRVPQPVERACFRVLQEGLSNVLHHAKATEVWVRVHQGVSQLELEIHDNGIGFDSNAFHEEKPREGASLGSVGQHSNLCVSRDRCVWQAQLPARVVAPKKNTLITNKNTNLPSLAAP